MKRRLRGLLNSTSILPLPGKTVFHSTESSKAVERRETLSGSLSAGILFTNVIQVPKLASTDIKDLNASEQPQFVTRHIRKDLLQIHLEGSFRFGTIASYKGTEDQQLGRFGDATEGRQRTVYSSRSGHFDDFQMEGFQIQNSYFGTENHVVFEYTTNDFCSCSSTGSFDPNRAEAIREAEKGNAATLTDAYVTYDVGKLVAALDSILLEHPNLSRCQLIRRKVIYGHKDVRWDIGRKFKSDERKPLETWLDAAFVKPTAFSHEEEFRILIVDPESPGRLKESALPVDFKDERIVSAVVAHGTF